jgi:hypothetical protein
MTEGLLGAESVSDLSQSKAERLRRNYTMVFVF